MPSASPESTDPREIERKTKQRDVAIVAEESLAVDIDYDLSVQVQCQPADIDQPQVLHHISY